MKRTVQMARSSIPSAKKKSKFLGFRKVRVTRYFDPCRDRSWSMRLKPLDSSWIPMTTWEHA